MAKVLLVILALVVIANLLISLVEPFNQILAYNGANFYSLVTHKF